MIDARELRIGNLVYSDFGKAEEIMELTTGYDIQSVDENLDNYDPIPLTAEWLKRMGFQSEETTMDKPSFVDNETGLYLSERVIRKIWHVTAFSLIEEKDGKIVIAGWGRIPLYYVHQLQNLFFALCGEELAIKP